MTWQDDQKKVATGVTGGLVLAKFDGTVLLNIDGSPNTKREWVGLTEPERVEIAGGELTRDERMIAIAIEAKLKEKNT